MQYCSLQHWTWLSPTDTTEHHFCFGPAASFFLELSVIALCSFPVAYWISSYLEGSYSRIISFCLFILFMGFSWQEFWSGLPFPPPGDHVSSELCTVTHPSWVTLHAWLILQWVTQASLPQQGCDPWRGVCNWVVDKLKFSVFFCPGEQFPHEHSSHVAKFCFSFLYLFFYYLSLNALSISFFFFFIATIEKVRLSWASCVLQVESKEGPKSISAFFNTWEPLLSLLP